MAVSRLRRQAEAWLRIAALTAAVVLLVVSVAVGAGIYRGVLIVLFVGVLAQVAALPLGLVRPRLAAPVSLAGAVVIMTSAHAPGTPWPWAVTTIITQALVLAVLGYRALWWLGAGTWVVAIALSGLVAVLVTPAHDQQAVSVNLVVAASITGTALVAGMVVKEGETIRRQLVSERRLTEDERARRLLAEEKTRIARELHDVIAHSMSVITVQATSAPYRHPQVDDDLRHEFEDIAASSRRALAEMRSLLGVLRDPDAPIARTPPPQLSGIPQLVTQSQRSGLDVKLHGGEVLTDQGVDDAVGLTAYRIVQEALSNVIRHSRGAEVEVRAQRGEQLDLVIANRGGAAADLDLEADEHEESTGSGLLGMRERAASVGGTLAFGPLDDGGYEVHVTLPLHRPHDVDVDV